MTDLALLDVELVADILMLRPLVDLCMLAEDICRGDQ